MLGDQPLELADDLCMASALEIGLQSLLETLEAKLVESRDLVLREAVVRQIGERPAAPEAEGRVEGASQPRPDRPRRGPFRPSARSLAARSASSSSGATSST